MTDKKERPAHDAYDIVPAKAADYPMLVDIWEASVRATHTFLAEADLQRLRSRLATDYFPAVELHMLLTDGRPVGFAGLSGDNLEMLFVHPDFFGRGLGRALLSFAIREKGVTRVDVNEQNKRAEASARPRATKPTPTDFPTPYCTWPCGSSRSPRPHTLCSPAAGKEFPPQPKKTDSVYSGTCTVTDTYPRSRPSGHSGTGLQTAKTRSAVSISRKYVTLFRSPGRTRRTTPAIKPLANSMFHT